MANSNTNRTKSWLQRLRQLSLNSTSREEYSNSEFNSAVFRRPVSNSDTTTCSRTRSSFRKSLRKMHTRVRSVFLSNNSSPNYRQTNAHISSLPASSSSHSRVTLSSRTSHIENIYSLEPVKRPTYEYGVEEPVSENSENCLVSGYANSSSNTISPEPPPISPRRGQSERNFPQLSEIQNGRVPKVEVVSLSNFYWYWGPITRTQAEDRLRNFPDGAFLIRDSSSDKYIFTMSFRSVGRTLHTRIELNKNGYSLFNLGGYHSIAELVNDALTKSKNGVYCYTKSTDEISPNYPVRLTLPVSRYDKVPSLKHLSRFVIRQCISINDTEKLPLPRSLLIYLKEDGSYF